MKARSSDGSLASGIAKSAAMASFAAIAVGNLNSRASASNGWRGWLWRRHVRWRPVAAYAAGAVAAALQARRLLLLTDVAGVKDAEKAGDEATLNLLEAFADEQEKTAWMMRAFLG